MTSPPSRKKQKNAFFLSFWCVFVCCAETYTRLKSHKHERTNERERERENSARSAPLLKRCLKRREKSLFLSLFLSSSLALTQTTFAPKKRFDLSFFLFPFSSGIVVSRTSFSFLLSLFSRLVSRVKLDEIARFEIYIYIYIRARARPTRSATNEYSEREERKTKKRRKKKMKRCLRVQLQRARSL